MPSSPAWQRKAGKDPSGGLNAAGRRSLKAEGRDIKPPVSKAEAKASPEKAKRRVAFCRRMQGMKQKLTSKETANDPDSRVNKSLRKWEC
jgi:hypothetical protein